MTVPQRTIWQTDRQGWNAWLVFDLREWLIGVSSDADGWLWLHIPTLSLAVFREEDDESHVS